MKKMSFLLVGLMLLSACSEEEATPVEPEETEEVAVEEEEQEDAVEKEMTESGFITQIQNDRILVNNVFFTVGEEVEVDSTDGSETSEAVLSDLRTGMKVDVSYTGTLEEGFPLTGEADSITILNDEETLEQTEALQAYINQEQISTLIILGLPIVSDGEIRFLSNDTATGDLQEVRIDLETQEYTIGNNEGTEEETEETAETEEAS